MKAHTITFDTESTFSGIASRRKKYIHRLTQALLTALMVLISALPAFTMIILFTWGSSIPSLLPYMQAVTWLSGFVFLALALDSEKLVAVLQVLSAAAMFTLALIATSVSPELLIFAAAIAAAWTVPGLFRYTGRISAQQRLSGEEWPTSGRY